MGFLLEKLGYTEKELMASPISSFIHPEDKQFISHKRAELLNGKPLLNFQNRYVAKSGAFYGLNGRPSIFRTMKWFSPSRKTSPKEELAQLASVLKTDIEWIKNSAVELTPPDNRYLPG